MGYELSTYVIETSLMSKREQKTRPRFSREQWLGRALELLAREGEAKIRIDALVRRIGVTKGSFYWHFRNRDDFLVQLVTYWAENSTQPVIDHINSVMGSPEKRLLALMEFLLRFESAEYDIAIRTLVQHEPQLRPIVKRLDRRRFNYIRGIFADMGFTGQELDMRTKTFVVYHSLEHGHHVHGSLAERRRLVKVRHAFFVRK